jgi:hypothetical protein
MVAAWAFMVAAWAFNSSLIVWQGAGLDVIIFSVRLPRSLDKERRTNRLCKPFVCQLVVSLLVFGAKTREQTWVLSIGPCRRNCLQVSWCTRSARRDYPLLYGVSTCLLRCSQQTDLSVLTLEPCRRNCLQVPWCMRSARTQTYSVQTSMQFLLFSNHANRYADGFSLAASCLSCLSNHLDRDSWASVFSIQKLCGLWLPSRFLLTLSASLPVILMSTLRSLPAMWNRRRSIRAWIHPRH